MSGAERDEIEAKCRELAPIIDRRLPPGCGFALLIFNFGERGGMAYISNAERESMIKGIEEWLQSVKEKP